MSNQLQIQDAQSGLTYANTTTEEAGNRIMWLIENLAPQDGYDEQTNAFLDAVQATISELAGDVVALREVARIMSALLQGQQQMIADLHMQRDMLAADLDWQKRYGKHQASDSLIHGMASRYAISSEASKWLLEHITGDDHWGLNSYAQRILKDAITTAGQEIDDFLEADAKPIAWEDEEDADLDE